MAGYVRVDTSNNISDGNVIAAADLDNEFDGIQAAFNASTGHNHDGTTGEGAPILVLGPTQDVVVGSSTVTPKTTNTVDIGSSSLKFKYLFLAGNASIGGTLGVTGATTLSAALTYGGVTLSNAVTGTGNMVLSASPTLTGTISGANASLSGTLAVTGVATLTAQPILSSLTASRAVFTDGSKGLVSNAITGTGNVVMSASPTLTGTITAEALTLSGAVTASAGTANGVAYLNGSKVLTTGSALTFDGSNFTANGLRLNGADVTNTIYQATGTLGISTGSASGIVFSTNFTQRYTIDGTGVSTWSVGGSEKMRLTSTGLGIGTASPSVKLHVIGTSIVGAAGTPGFTSYKSTGVPDGFDVGLLGGDASATGFIYNRNNGAVVFGTNGTERMRLDASGNLGIGTSSPNASAILDAQSTTKGVRMPNMTTTQKNAIASPAAGLMVFDTTLAKLCVYSGAAWETITSI